MQFGTISMLESQHRDRSVSSEMALKSLNIDGLRLSRCWNHNIEIVSNLPTRPKIVPFHQLPTRPKIVPFHPKWHDLDVGIPTCWSSQTANKTKDRPEMGLSRCWDPNMEIIRFWLIYHIYMNHIFTYIWIIYIYSY